MKWLNIKSLEDHRNYKQNKTQLRNPIKTEKNAIWNKECQEVDTYIGGKKYSEIWRFLKNVKNPSEDKSNIRVIDPEEWKKTLSEPTARNQNTITRERYH